MDGSAAIALSGLQLTSANYDAALEILKERFAQKQVIINLHMELLIRLKPVNAMSDVRGIEIQVRGLQSLRVDSAQYGGTLLIPIFMEKLPDELKLIVSRKQKDDWRLDSVLMAVKSEVEARKRSGMRSTPEKPAPKKPTLPEIGSGTASTFLAGGSKDFSGLFCKGTHRASGYSWQTVFQPSAILGGLQ